MDDYKDIKQLLKPRHDIRASEELRKKVRNALERDERKPFMQRWLVGSISLGAVAAILILLLMPTGISAREVLNDAVKAMRGIERIEMIVEVRTRLMENFRYIAINEEFVVHRIEVTETDSSPAWRVDKGGRVAARIGDDVYTWIPRLKLGWHLVDTDSEDILGYMSILLNPRKILEQELANCESANEKYDVRNDGREIILTIHAGPHGNFKNPYLLNTSVDESENIRRYVLDANSKRLKSATVSIVSGNREITVLRISYIDYNPKPKTASRLPEGILFVETENGPDGLKGLSAEEAASAVLSAFSDWDSAILDKVMIREISDGTYRDKFLGAKLISIGKSFTSGSGNSIFVPYTLELRDGTLQRHNISLQRTDAGGWIVTGGL